MRDEQLREYQRQTLERIRRVSNPPFILDTETRSIRPMEFQRQISGRWASTTEQPQALTTETLQRARELLDRNANERIPTEFLNSARREMELYGRSIVETIIDEAGSLDLVGWKSDWTTFTPTMINKKEEKPWLD